jgi:hypothetical protein
MYFYGAKQMALVDLGDATKKVIVALALLAIIALKIAGIFTTKPTIFMIIALGFVSVITDASPVAAGTLDGRTVTQ